MRTKMYHVVWMCMIVLLAGGYLQAQQMEVIFEDDFSDNRNDWSESDSENNRLAVENGAYNFHHKAEEGAWLTWKEIAIDQQTDFTIQTTITKVSGVDNYGYGVLWGLKDVDHYYQFALSGNGHYRYVKASGDDWTDIIAWTQSELILQNDGAINTISIKKEGQQLTFYVNDQFLAEAQFESFFGENVGFIVYNQLQVAIDSLRVEQLMPEQPQPPAQTTSTQPPEREKDPPPSKPVNVSASKIALVIGNSAYHDPPLATPQNDADVIAQTLEALGFYVIHETNVTRQAMEKALRTFVELLPNREMGLFYFSGYAAQRRSENYLLPVGGDVRSEDYLPYEAIKFTDVINQIHSAGSRANMLILDACRGIEGLWLFQKGLAPTQAPLGTVIVYAAMPDHLAPEIGGKHSVFTRHIQNLLQQTDIPGRDMLEQMKQDVHNETEGRQIPWFSYALQE